MEKTSKEIAVLFKALCDENRIEILKLLKNGERCICTILEDINISQSTLSHHMKILSDANFVKSRKDGKWTHYSINAETYTFAIDILNEFSDIRNEKDLCKCKGSLN